MSSTNTLSIALSPFLPLSAFSFSANGQCRLLSVEAVYHSLIGSAGKTRKTINNGRAICKQRQVSPTETRTNSGRSTKPSNSTAVRPINKIMAKIIEIFAVNVLTSVRPGLAQLRHQLRTSSGLFLVTRRQRCKLYKWRLVMAMLFSNCRQPDRRSWGLEGRRSPSLKNDAKIDISLGQRVCVRAEEIIMF